MVWLRPTRPRLLDYLLNSFSPEILQHVLRLEHAADVWIAVEAMFASQSCSKVTNLRIAMANTKKLNMSTPAYFAKMQNLADSLAVAGRPADDESSSPLFWPDQAIHTVDLLRPLVS
jgi:hypothetical protein